MKLAPILSLLSAMLFVDGCNRDAPLTVPPPVVECTMLGTFLGEQMLEDDIKQAQYNQVILSFCNTPKDVEVCADIKGPIGNFQIVKSKDTGSANPFGYEDYNLTFRVTPLEHGNWENFFCNGQQCLGPVGNVWLSLTAPTGLSLNALVTSVGDESALGACRLVEGT